MTPEHKIIVDQHAKAIARRFEKELTNIKRQLRRDTQTIMEEVYEKTIGDVVNHLTNMQSMMENHDKKLSLIEEVAEKVEETLCNVLLAIRQNEYLQAWYPAQKGYAEMKVVGKHPLQGKKNSGC